MPAVSLNDWKQVFWDLIRFREYEKEPWHRRGLRIMPVDNYCVFYIPDSKKAVVTIIRVMFGGQDMDMQLRRFTKSQI